MKLNVLTVMTNNVAYSIDRSEFKKLIKEEMINVSKQVANEYFTDMGYNYSSEDITYIIGKNDLESNDKRKRDLKDIIDNSKIIYDNSIDFIIIIDSGNSSDNLFDFITLLCNNVIDKNYSAIDLSYILDLVRSKYPEKLEGKVIGLLNRR